MIANTAHSHGQWTFCCQFGVYRIGLLLFFFCCLQRFFPSVLWLHFVSVLGAFVALGFGRENDSITPFTHFICVYAIDFFFTLLVVAGSFNRLLKMPKCSLKFTEDEKKKHHEAKKEKKSIYYIETKKNWNTSRS